MSGSDLVVNGLWYVSASLQDKQLFGQLAGQTICRIFVEELVRSVLNKRRHFSSVGVGVHDYGYLLVQNADCRPDTKCRLGTKCRLQTAEWVQNAD